MRYQEIITEAAKQPLAIFLAKICSLCGAKRPSVKNTEMDGGYARYSSSVHDTNDDGAARYLKSLGFTEEDVKATGSSSRGDFSSDRYGSTYQHPNGASVRCSSFFGGMKATFNVSINATDEQLADFNLVATKTARTPKAQPISWGTPPTEPGLTFDVDGKFMVALKAESTPDTPWAELVLDQSGGKIRVYINSKDHTPTAEFTSAEEAYAYVIQKFREGA